MSQVIKVEDQVYQQLESLKAKGQTFSDVIEDLLNARLRVCELISVLEGQLKYREWQKEKLERLTSADAVRRDIEARTIK